MSDAAAVREQCLCVGSDSFHRNIVDPDIGGSAVEMLTIPGGVFEGAVVGCGAVSASETHRLTEMVPDRLEQPDQIAVDEDWVRMIGAGELPDTKVLAQFLFDILCERVRQKCQFISPFCC